jgi:hypothetical protein
MHPEVCDRNTHHQLPNDLIEHQWALVGMSENME